jgi:SAM-dependent methyltransferase
MEQQLIQIREQQKDSWNRFSSGWKKWDDLTMRFLQPMGDAIIDRLGPHNGQVVLDVAAGTGEPGLTIASRLRGGRVVISDLAEDMLAVARENAERRGITNVETRACDVCELPFADNAFDAISCRFGFMFSPTCGWPPKRCTACSGPAEKSRLRCGAAPSIIFGSRPSWAPSTATWTCPLPRPARPVCSAAQKTASWPTCSRRRVSKT